MYNDLLLVFNRKQTECQSQNKNEMKVAVGAQSSPQRSAGGQGEGKSDTRYGFQFSIQWLQYSRTIYQRLKKVFEKLKQECGKGI